MSDDGQKLEKQFCIEIAKQGKTLCKKCKQKCVEGDLRIAKLIPNPVGSGNIKSWYHVNCIFEVFLKQRQTTKRIEGPHDIEGWEVLDCEDKVDILKKIADCNKAFEAKSNKSADKQKRNKVLLNEESLSFTSDVTVKEEIHKDNLFREFRTIVANVSNVTSSSEKVQIFREIFSKGRDGSGFKGDIYLWCKLLLPAIVKRVFHLQTKQLVKIFSKIFLISDDTMMNHLDQGDVGLTIHYFFERNKDLKPAKKSTLTIFEVDEFLETLTTLTKEEDQCNHFRTFIKKCTSNDLKVVIRLIKHDLRMNAGAKHVFEGIHPDAYLIFQSCRDVKMVLNACWGVPAKKEKSNLKERKSPRKSPKRKRSTLEPKAKKTKLTESNVPESKKENFEIEAVEAKQKCKLIPSYFENVRLYLEEGVAERHAEWIRYFIAYGGTVLKPHEFDEATHVLHLRDTITEPTIKCVNIARHVIIEWIKDTVEKETLQDYKPYTVRWKPSYIN